MKALKLYAPGELVYEDVETPKPAGGEVLLKVRACGICSSDEDRVLRKGTYFFPTIPGHEFAGEIVEVGPGVDHSYIGRKASVFPLLPCRKCSACSTGDYPMCSDYKYFGSRNDGGFAEYLAVPVWNLVLLDDSIDFKVGALMEPAAVSRHAVNIGGIKAGQDVAVIGTGSIGVLIGAFCKMQGANVYICGRRKESLENIEKFGFNIIDVNNIKEKAFEVTAGKGMDVAFEVVGSNIAMENAIVSVKNAGIVVAVGNPEKDFQLPRDVYWRVLRGQLEIRGTWNSDFNERLNDWEVVADMMKEGTFPFEQLITRTYKLSEHKHAFDDLTDAELSKIKLMFVME